MTHRFLTVLGVLVFFFGCGPDTDIVIANAEAAILIFPENNTECNTGISVSDTESEVEFQWEEAAYTEQYTLELTNLLDNTTAQYNSSNNTLVVAIKKGTPYSWSVASSNRFSDAVLSETWQFYNAGALVSYPPFPAEQVFPRSGQTVVRDNNNQIQLQWNGADLDNDIVQYQVYLSQQNPPESVLQTVANDITSLLVDVDSGSIYFWQVVSIDADGNTSASGIIDFRVAP